jgi:L-seryl-tRNA(Ser) seleniumtransferase
MNEKPDLRALADLAHRYQLPLIVDAACALPPKENLTVLSQSGADLVAYSGGKHLGGPQASGILCGRADLIRSAWVQMVDMDVREGTWSLQHWVHSGWMTRAPRHGIGRYMKVSKESIVGVMAALKRYADRDAEEEYSLWKSQIDTIFAGIADLPELRITQHTHGMNGQPYPNLQIESGASSTAMSVRELLLTLRQRRGSPINEPAAAKESSEARAGNVRAKYSDGPRNIILAEDEQSPDRAFLYAQCLQPGDAEEIVVAIQQAVSHFRDRIRI